MANLVDPNHNAPLGEVWTESTVFADDSLKTSSPWQTD